MLMKGQDKRGDYCTYWPLRFTIFILILVQAVVWRISAYMSPAFEGNVAVLDILTHDLRVCGYNVAGVQQSQKSSVSSCQVDVLNWVSHRGLKHGLIIASGLALRLYETLFPRRLPDN